MIGTSELSDVLVRGGEFGEVQLQMVDVVEGGQVFRGPDFDHNLIGSAHGNAELGHIKALGSVAGRHLIRAGVTDPDQYALAVDALVAQDPPLTEFHKVGVVGDFRLGARRAFVDHLEAGRLSRQRGETE